MRQLSHGVPSFSQSTAGQALEVERLMGTVCVAIPALVWAMASPSLDLEPATANNGFWPWSWRTSSRTGGCGALATWAEPGFQCCALWVNASIHEASPTSRVY